MMTRATPASGNLVTRATPLAMVRPTNELAPPWLVLGFLVVALQRLSLPFGDVQVPLTTVLVLVISMSMVIKGVWVVAQPRLLPALAFVSIALVNIGLMGGAAPMFSALALVIALWSPGLLRENQVAPGRPDVAPSFCTGVAAATSLGGFAGALQSALTWVGGPFVDPLTLVPYPFSVSGYKAAQTVDFGGSWYKANGLVFLEPSFLSLTCSIALLLVVGNTVVYNARFRIWMIVGLILGILSSGAISGVVLIPFVLAAVVRSSRALVAGAFGLIVVVSVAFTTPFAQSFIDRLVFRSGSNDARLIRPYDQILPIALELSPWLGLGPGTARDLADRLTANNWQTEVTTPTLVKVVFEYGLAGLALGSIFLLLIVGPSALPAMVKAGLVAAVVIPTDGLTSHVLVPIFVFALFSGRAADGHSGDPGASPAHRSWSGGRRQ